MSGPVLTGRLTSSVRFPEVALDNPSFDVSPRVLRAARTGNSYFRNQFLPCVVFNVPPHCCDGRSLLQTGCAPA
jgi:hypothetical protein